MKVLGEGEQEYAGRYRLLALLGEGGMGRVYLAVAPDGRPAALKRIHPAFSHDQDFRERFRREVATSRRVSGAFTAAVMDADTEADQQWLASVYVAGPSLQDAVDKAGPLPPTAVRHLAAGLVSAVADIHRAGLVHRDLKPSNVLLASEGPRVIDFGIARAIEGSSELTSTGSVVGSAGFTSPEQAEGRTLSTASDIFSLGTLLVMAATGKSPYAGSTTPQTLYNVVHGEPDLRGVPPELMPIIAPCLARDPAQRPTPDQLRGLIGNLPPTNHPWPTRVHQEIARCEQDVDAAMSGAGRSRSRSGLVVALATLVMVVALGATALIGITQSESGTPTTVAANVATSSTTAEEPTGPLAPASLRKLDPCKLIPSLQASSDSYYSGCSFSTDDGLNVSLEVGGTATSTGDAGNEQVAGLPAMKRKSDGETCTVTALLPDQPTNGIEVRASNFGNDRKPKGFKPCERAKKPLAEAIGTARKGKATWSGGYATLAEVDPCQAIAPEQAQEVFNQTPSTEIYDLHECEYNAGGTATVGLRVTSDPAEDGEGEKIRIAGRTAYQIPSSIGTADCDVSWAHAPAEGEEADDYAQVVTVSYDAPTGDDQATTQTACQRARTLAEPVLEGLPTS